ncbi:hypothetical protein N5D52_28540 [Pseudomonas sp. GD03860]|nr:MULTISPECIES: hypothetical protein [Pseudomonas]MDD2058438.1 hypothetical protein [Pseudomonas putida]MDH0640880.1 hypothetical protein [Pseudomonas sp. GD03860]
MSLSASDFYDYFADCGLLLRITDQVSDADADADADAAQSLA